MFVKISAFFFFYFSIISTYVIFLPQILSQLGYSAFQVGVIFSTAPFVRFLLPFIIRRYFVLNLRAFYISLVVMLISGSLFYSSLDNFWFFWCLNVPFGACLGVILPFIESYALEKLQKERYGKARLFGSLGFIVVSVILAKVLNNPYDSIDFLVGSICFTMLFSILIVHKNSSFRGLKKDFPFALNLLKFKYYWITLVLIQVSFGGFYNFFTIYEKEQGVDLVTISFLWSFGVICEIIFFYFQNFFLQKIALHKLIQFAVFMTSIRWLLLYLFPTSLSIAFFSQSFHALSFALLHTTCFLYLQTMYEDKKLSSQFYYGLTFGPGAFIGALLAGVMYGEYIYLFCSFIAFVAFLYSRKIVSI